MGTIRVRILTSFSLAMLPPVAVPNNFPLTMMGFPATSANGLLAHYSYWMAIRSSTSEIWPWTPPESHHSTVPGYLSTLLHPAKSMRSQLQPHHARTLPPTQPRFSSLCTVCTQASKPPSKPPSPCPSSWLRPPEIRPATARRTLKPNRSQTGIVRCNRCQLPRPSLVSFEALVQGHLSFSPHR